MGTTETSQQAPDFEAEIARIKTDIMHGSHILSGLGVLDAFGHVSSRVPGQPDRFLMSRIMAPGLVQLEDIHVHDLNGDIVSAQGVKPFLERFIHAEIYRARPDVTGIVHSHSKSVLPFTVVPEARLRPICHVCGFLDGLGAPFDVADHAGDGTDLLISNRQLGVALAEHLGMTQVVLMRGHGFTAVGTSVREAVFRAVYTGINSDIQLEASRLGTPRFLTSAEALACDETTMINVNRVWLLWLRRFIEKAE